MRIKHYQMSLYGGLLRAFQTENHRGRDMQEHNKKYLQGVPQSEIVAKSLLGTRFQHTNSTYNFTP